MDVEISRERLIRSMQAQAGIGGDGERTLDRVSLSDNDAAARDWFADELRNLGLDVRVDAVGNQFGRRSGTAADAEPVLVGSHLDSQPEGGIYDGALGIVAALEFIRSLDEYDVRTRRPIEVVNWTNEEGTRFAPTTMGSGVWSGHLDRETAYGATDADGARFEEALERIGYKGDHPAEPSETYEAYLELHVEQGPRLDNVGAPVGVVTGVAGLSWGELTFTGTADHSGTTPMDARSDALVAAATVVTDLREIGLSMGPETVATCGAVTVQPNSINVIPESAEITWDIRDPDADRVARGYRRTIEAAEAAATEEGVELEYEERIRSNPVSFDQTCIETVAEAANRLGYDTMRLPSGATHDAAHVASICDTGMIFAPSKDGRSHSPAEFTSWDDCYRAANTFANAALALANS